MAGSLNKVMIIGRIGKDPETKYTQSGAAVVNLTIATDEGYTKDGQKVEKTEWHRVVLWNKAAEFAGKYLGKGRLVYVEGKIETRKWQDQQGVDKYTTEIKAYTIQPLDKKPDGQQAPTPQPQQSAGTAKPSVGENFPQTAANIEDCPF